MTSLVIVSPRSLSLGPLGLELLDARVSQEHGGEYGGRWCRVSSGRFSIFGRHSPCLVHLESANNTLIEEKVTYKTLFFEYTC